MAADRARRCRRHRCRYTCGIRLCNRVSLRLIAWRPEQPQQWWQAPGWRLISGEADGAVAAGINRQSDSSLRPKNGRPPRHRALVCLIGQPIFAPCSARCLRFAGIGCASAASAKTTRRANDATVSGDVNMTQHRTAQGQRAPMEEPQRRPRVTARSTTSRMQMARMDPSRHQQRASPTMGDIKLRPSPRPRQRIGSHAYSSGSIGEWDAGDDSDPIPPRGWLLGNTFCRRWCQACRRAAAPANGAPDRPGACHGDGQALTGEHVFQRCRVLILSFEDDRDELRRRVRAAMKHHGVSPSDVRGWLFLARRPLWAGSWPS